MSAERISELLQAANQLPDSLRAWLTTGLQGWQQGQDLERALGLCSHPAIDHDERDGYIRASIRLCPGESDSAQMYFFIGVINGEAAHPDPTGRQFIELLARSRVYIPRTTRHLRRILQGRRQDGWKCKRDITAVVSLDVAAG